MLSLAVAASRRLRRGFGSDPGISRGVWGGCVVCGSRCFAPGVRRTPPWARQGPVYRSPTPHGASCVVTVSAMAVTAMVCRGVVSRLWWVAPVVLHLVARLCRIGCGRGCDVIVGPLVWGC